MGTVVKAEARAVVVGGGRSQDDRRADSQQRGTVWGQLGAIRGGLWAVCGRFAGGGLEWPAWLTWPSARSLLLAVVFSFSVYILSN